MTEKKEEKFSLIQNLIKPSSSHEFSGRKECDESKFDPIKNGKHVNFVSIDNDSSTHETIQLDGSKSSVLSSVECDEQKAHYSILDRFEVHMKENRRMQRKGTVGTHTSLNSKHQESAQRSKDGSNRCAELPTKSKDYGIIVNIESISGKNRVLKTRELSALKVLTGGNHDKNTGISPRTNSSQIAGQRLYSQAQQSSEKIAYLREVSRSSTPVMELYTQSYETPLNWGISPSKRFLALYEQGKKRVSSDRQLHKELSEENVPSLNKLTARYANVRLVNIYEHGRKRLLERKQQSNVTENYAGVADVKTTARYANMRQVQLYELGRQRVEKGRNINDKTEHTQKKIARYASSRESELYILGKRKITKSRDRECKKKMKVRHNLSIEDLASLRPNRLQIRLSELGRQQIINQRLNAERQKENHYLFSCRLPPRFGKE